MAQRSAPRQLNEVKLVDLTEDELIELTKDFVDLTIEERVEAAIDLTTDIDDLRAETPSPRGDLDPIPEGFDSILQYDIDGHTYVSGAGLELVDGHFGDCFRVVHIIQCQQTRKVLFRGFRLSSTKRPERTRSFLPRDHKMRSLSNEYCIISPTIEDLESGDLARCLVNLEPADVYGPREIIFTNAHFPAYSHFEEPSLQHKTRGEARKDGRIVVRWKYATAMNKSHTSFVRGRIERLAQEECDTPYRVLDAKLRKDFRAHESVAGDRRGKKRDYVDLTEAAIDLTETTAGETAPAKPQRKRPIKHAFPVNKVPQHKTAEKTLTIGDICTGGGGILSGAVQGGLRPIFAIDNWDVACATSHRNFDKYHTPILEKSVFDFLGGPDLPFQWADIVHMSWPCPYYSPSKTRPHSDPEVDANNESCIYATGDVLLKCKPRVATFEQTSGLVNGWPEVFERFINLITSTNYSVCWEVPDLAQYGATSHRLRLIAIASCPGEALPTFPPPTHGLGPGKKRLNYIRDALRAAERTAAPDGLDERGGSRARQGPSHDGRRLLQNTPTCNGLTEAHYSGRRAYNLFEHSLLCGFPPEHRFCGTNTEIRRQLGNAVPAPFAKTMFVHIAKCMRESDRRLAAYKPEVVTLLDD